MSGDFSVSKTLSSLLGDIGIDGDTQRLLTGSHDVAGTVVTTSVQGMAQLEKALDALPDAIAQKILKQAITEAGEMFRQRCEDLSPYDTAKAPPHLADNILKSVTIEKDGIRCRVGLRVKPKDESVFYGRFIEQGWVAHGNVRARDSVPGAKANVRGGTDVDPHPFFRPAFDQTKYAAAARIQQRLQAGIEAAVKAAGGK